MVVDNNNKLQIYKSTSVPVLSKVSYTS